MENFIFCAVWETFFMQFLPDMCLVSVNELNENYFYILAIFYSVFGI